MSSQASRDEGTRMVFTSARSIAPQTAFVTSRSAAVREFVPRRDERGQLARSFAIGVDAGYNWMADLPQPVGVAEELQRVRGRPGAWMVVWQRNPRAAMTGCVTDGRYIARSESLAGNMCIRAKGRRIDVKSGAGTA